MMPDTVRTIRLDPNYENVARRMAAGLANGEFDKGSERQVMATLIDQIRYLTNTDEDAVFRIMNELDPSRPRSRAEALLAMAGRDRDVTGG